MGEVVTNVICTTLLHVTLQRPAGSTAICLIMEVYPQFLKYGGWYFKDVADETVPRILHEMGCKYTVARPRGWAYKREAVGEFCHASSYTIQFHTNLSVRSGTITIKPTTFALISFLV